MDDWNDTAIAGDAWVTGERDRATRAYAPPIDPHEDELYETQPHELVYQEEEEDRRVWSVIGPGALAVGLLVLSVAIGSYLGMRSADDGGTEDARWPGEGPETATSAADEDTESESLEDDGDVESGSERAEGDAPSVEGEVTDAATDGDDGSGGHSGGLPPVDVADAEPASAASDRPGSPAEDSGGNSTTSTTAPDGDGGPPHDDPEECTWAPPGRPDHLNATDRPEACED
jgi:hypothetical protein